MELTRSLVETKAREYREAEPLSDVERQHVEMLPETFAGGEYGWRDVEWVVQWYFRRYLGAYPDRRRRATEEAFRENDFDDVVAAVTAVADEEADDPAGKLDRLTALSGVEVPVASAFLMFSFPDRYAAIGEREWIVLQGAGELDGPYPDPPSIDQYLQYHDVCRTLAGEFDVGAWTLYRALWRLWKDRFDSA